jgi:hypothetical protein
MKICPLTVLYRRNCPYYWPCKDYWLLYVPPGLMFKVIGRVFLHFYESWNDQPLLLHRTLTVRVLWSRQKVFTARYEGKGKGLPQQAEVAQGVPGRLRPRICLTFGTTRVVGRQPYAPAGGTNRTLNKIRVSTRLWTVDNSGDNCMRTVGMHVYIANVTPSSPVQHHYCHYCENIKPCKRFKPKKWDEK